jgi:hypothetical protein
MSALAGEGSCRALAQAEVRGAGRSGFHASPCFRHHSLALSPCPAMVTCQCWSAVMGVGDRGVKCEGVREPGDPEDLQDPAAAGHEIE